MIMKFTLHYGTTLDEGQAAILSTIVGTPVDINDPHHSYRAYTGDIREISKRLPGINILVETGELGGTVFQEILRRLSAMEAALEAGHQGGAQSYNHKVNVHVPGLGLLLIDEVEVMTNECTRSLQGYLEEGWRILAICPQPDQRRPDYVMGRTKTRER